MSRQNAGKVKTLSLVIVIIAIIMLLVFLPMLYYATNTELSESNTNYVNYDELDKIEIDASKPISLDYSRTSALVKLESWENNYLKITAKKGADNKLRAEITRNEDYNKITLTDFGISSDEGYVVYTTQTWLPLLQFDKYRDSRFNSRVYECTINIPNGLSLDVRGNRYYD